MPLPQQKVTILPHHAKLQQQLQQQHPPFPNPPIVNNHTGPRTKGQGEHNPIYGSPVVVVTPPGVKSKNTPPSPPPPAPQISGKTPLPSPSSSSKKVEEEEVDPSLLCSSPAVNSLNEDISGSESEEEAMEVEKEEDEKPITHPPPPPVPAATDLGTLADDEGKKAKKKKESSSTTTTHKPSAKSSRRGVAAPKSVEEGEEEEKPKKGKGSAGRGKKKSEDDGKPTVKVPTAEEVARAMLAIKEKEKEKKEDTKKFSNPSVSSPRPPPIPQNLKRLTAEEGAGLSFSSFFTQGEDGRLSLNSFRVRSKPAKLSEIPDNTEVTFVNWYLRRGIYGPYYVLISKEGKEFYSDEPTYFALENGRPDGYLPGKVLFHVKNIPCWGMEYSFSLVKKNNDN